MPRKIAHDDGFEISFSHQDERLTIYDSVEVADSSQAEASKTTAHVGNFSGALNKVMVQRKTSIDLLLIQLFIVRGFDFLSGNAVQFALHVVTASGDKEQVPLGAISKKRHDKKPKDPTGFAWFAVQGSEAPTGTVLVSVTRGTEDEDTRVFTPLNSEPDEPYIVQIEWRSIDDGATRRVTRGMQNGSSTPPPVSRKRPAKTTKPKATKSVEHSGSPSKTDKPTELTRAESSSGLVSQGNKDNDIEPIVEPTADSQKQAAGGADSNQEPTLPIRLRDEDNGANVLQSENATGSGDADVFTTPPATFATSGVPEGSVIGSTPTLAHESDNAGTPTRKRSAGEAFGYDRETDLIRLAFEVDMAKADFDVDDAKVQEMTDRTSPEYFGLTLKKAKSHHAVVDAELELKKAQLEGKKDAEYRELKTRKAEARLAVLAAEESAGVEKDRLAFKLEKAQAEFKAAKAKVKQMAYGGRKDDVELLRAMLKKAQANSGVALAEFENKAAECGDNKDTEYFQLQTRKAEARRAAVQAQGEILRKTGLLQ